MTWGHVGHPPCCPPCPSPQPPPACAPSTYRIPQQHDLDAAGQRPLLAGGALRGTEKVGLSGQTCGGKWGTCMCGKKLDNC